MANADAELGKAQGQLFLPSCYTSLRTSFEGPRAQTEKRRPKSTPRKARGPAMDTEPDMYHPHNYMIRGGSRIAEQQIKIMNKAAIKDLRLTNDMLAAEVMRTRSTYEEERSSLKEGNARLEGDLRMVQEKLRQAHEKLEGEVASRTALVTQHTSRLKEITKRLRDEHNQRLTAEAELNQHKLRIASLGVQVADTGELRGEVARLEAGAAGAAATIADLRSRLAAAENKLETDAGVRGNLESRLHAAEGALASMTERSSLLTGSVCDLEAQLGTSRSGLQDLTEELAYCKTTLQQEREAHGALRRSAGTLQADLTELQASSTLGAAQAAADKAELDRVRRDLCDLRLTHEATQDELAHLREEALHTKSELAGYKASAAELSVTCTDLRHELHQVTAQLTGEVISLRESKASELTALQDSKTQELAQLKEQTATELAALRQSSAAELSALRASHGAELGALKTAAGAEIDNLRKQVSTYKYQSENHEEVFVENQALNTKLQRTESSLRQKEAVLAEALTSHAAQLEMWRGEATEVAQAASKWKQRALGLQQQVSALESSSSHSAGEVTLLAGRCAALEGERAKLAESCALLESQLSACQQELTGCKLQLKESLSHQAAAARHAESTGHDAAQRAAAVDRLSARLVEETTKTSALRQDLAALTQQQVRELDAKSRMLSELTASLAREERSKDQAVREATSLRSHLATLERELRNAQVALSSISADKARSRGAYDTAEGALASAQRQADQFKHNHHAADNKELLDQCRTWMHTNHLNHQQPPPTTFDDDTAPHHHHASVLHHDQHAATDHAVPPPHHHRPSSAPGLYEPLHHHAHADAPSSPSLMLPGPPSPPPTPPSPRTALGQPPRGGWGQPPQTTVDQPPRSGLDQLLEEAVGHVDGVEAGHVSHVGSPGLAHVPRMGGTTHTHGGGHVHGGSNYHPHGAGGYPHGAGMPISQHGTGGAPAWTDASAWSTPHQQHVLATPTPMWPTWGPGTGAGAATGPGQGRMPSLGLTGYATGGTGGAGQWAATPMHGSGAYGATPAQGGTGAGTDAGWGCASMGGVGASGMMQGGGGGTGRSHAAEAAPPPPV